MVIHDGIPTKLCSPAGAVVKNLPANAGDVGLIPGSGRSPGEGNSNLFLPGEFHGQRNHGVRNSWTQLVILHPTLPN